jgi:hypothetical protein
MSTAMAPRLDRRTAAPSPAAPSTAPSGRPPWPPPVVKPDPRHRSQSPPRPLVPIWPAANRTHQPPGRNKRPSPVGRRTRCWQTRCEGRPIWPAASIPAILRSHVRPPNEWPNFPPRHFYKAPPPTSLSSFLLHHHQASQPSQPRLALLRLRSPHSFDPSQPRTSDLLNL